MVDGSANSSLQNAPKTHSDMVVLPARGQLVGLPNKVLILSRTRLLERKRLEIASRDRFAVVPTNFESPYTHFGGYGWAGRQIMQEWK